MQNSARLNVRTTVQVVVGILPGVGIAIQVVVDVRLCCRGSCAGIAIQVVVEVRMC